MAEFYGYRLQHRNIDGIALLQGDRLKHQYIVDAYVAIKQNHLKYLRLNKKKLLVVKYLFKYVYKGHDRATVEISCQSDNAIEGNVVEADEI